jgi:hypothetical protein
MLHDHNGSAEKNKIDGLEHQRTWGKNELIGGKPPVIKY